MNISAVIFDLDGTLLYTLDDLADSVNSVLSKFGFPLKTTDEVKSAVGNGVELLIERVIPDGRKNQLFDECLSHFRQNYSENMFNKTTPYPDIIDMLKNLKKQNIKTCVVSNKFDSAVKKLCETYFNGLFDVVIGQGDNIKPKPSPDGVNDAINRLNINKDECIFVGDSEVDIQTANNVGIPCISVTWGYKNIEFLYEHGAQTLIYSPMDLLELL